MGFNSGFKGLINMRNASVHNLAPDNV